MGEDSHSVFTNGGTALVIHANADDMKSDPAGNAGCAYRLRRDRQEINERLFWAGFFLITWRLAAFGPAPKDIHRFVRSNREYTKIFHFGQAPLLRTCEESVNILGWRAKCGQTPLIRKIRPKTAARLFLDDHAAGDTRTRIARGSLFISSAFA